MRKYKPFQFARMDEHAAWLASMARQGWHYQGQDWIGMQAFAPGAPAEVAYCWDQAPRDRRDAPPYRQQCREAGWEMASSVGRWYCWRQPVLDGQAIVPLRDAAVEKAMFKKVYRDAAATACIYLVLLALQAPNVTPELPWYRVLALLALAIACGLLFRDALRARARLRTLAASA